MRLQSQRRLDSRALSQVVLSGLAAAVLSVVVLAAVNISSFVTGDGDFFAFFAVVVGAVGFVSGLIVSAVATAGSRYGSRIRAGLSLLTGGVLAIVLSSLAAAGLHLIEPVFLGLCFGAVGTSATWFVLRRTKFARR